MDWTHVCARWISYNFLLKMGRWSHNQENIPLDTAFSDDRQLKTDSADSSSGLSNGRGGSRDINPAFDSESIDEVITLIIPYKCLFSIVNLTQGNKT